MRSPWPAVSFVVFCSLVFYPAPVNATVTVSSEAELRAALETGGRIGFAVDLDLLLTAEIRIIRDTFLHADGRQVTLSGNQCRVIFIDPGLSVTLSHLTIASGLANQGAGLYNAGSDVTVIGCVFSNNLAQGTPGQPGQPGTNSIAPVTHPTVGIAGPGSPGSAGEPGLGGAVFNRGSITLSNCLFVGNRARGGAGGAGGVGGNEAPYEVGFYAGNPGSGGDGGAGADGRGGAVFSEGPVNLFGTRFLANSVYGGLGGEAGAPGTRIQDPGYSIAPLPGNVGSPGSGLGGAIFAMGPWSAVDCVFDFNSARGAAAIPTPAGLDGQSGNHPGRDGGPGTLGGHAHGGAVYSAGEAWLARTRWHTNQVEGGEGGAGGDGGTGYDTCSGSIGGDGGAGGAGGEAMGGAVYSIADLRVYDSYFEGNVALGGFGGAGGGGGTSKVVFEAPDGAAGGSGGAARGGAVSQLSGDCLIDNSALLGNRTESRMGGLGGGPGSWQVGIYAGRGAVGTAGSTDEARGGAIFNAATVRITRTSLAYNVAQGGAGRVGNGNLFPYLRFHPASGGSGASGGTAAGGGLFNSGSIEISSAALLWNLCFGGQGGDGFPGEPSRYDPSGGGNGGRGGDALGGGILNAGELRLTNCTSAFNMVQAGEGGQGAPGGDSTWEDEPGTPGADGHMGQDLGAGFFTSTNGNSQLHFSTVAFNLGSGLHNNGRTALRGLLLAQTAGPNIAGTIQDLGYNLSSDASAVFEASTSRSEVDALLGQLRVPAHGRPFFPLLADSPAINAVPAAEAPNCDQNGTLRPIAGAADIGAFETDRAFTLSGRIVIADVGIARIRLRVGDRETISDAGGTFFLRGLSAGPHPVSALLDDGTVTLGAIEFGGDAATRSEEYLLPRAWLYAVTVEPGGAVLRVLAPAGGYCIIEASHDFFTWHRIGVAIAPATGAFEFRDPQTESHARFFRVQLHASSESVTRVGGGLTQTVAHTAP